MAARSIRARCKDCGWQLLMAEIARTGMVCCPHCGTQLAPGYGAVLLEEARRADALRREFVRCVQRLAELPGALQLDPASVFADTAADLDWYGMVSDERARLDAETADLRARVRAWSARSRRSRRPAAPDIAGRLRRLGQGLRLHARHRANPPGQAGDDLAQAALTQAADLLDAAASDVLADRRQARMHALKALRQAHDALARPIPQPAAAEPAAAGETRTGQAA